MCNTSIHVFPILYDTKCFTLQFSNFTIGNLIQKIDTAVFAYPAEKSPEVSSIFPENFFINLVQMNKEISNLDSFVLFTIQANIQAVCKLY